MKESCSNTDLAVQTQGLCLSPEELEEAQAGDSNAPTKFQDLDDAGLGDGEGTKDVSDKIDSEDMLEDAKRPEEYENNEADKDLQVCYCHFSVLALSIVHQEII